MPGEVCEHVGETLSSRKWNLLQLNFDAGQ
jgi:hypothetical protein